MARDRKGKKEKRKGKSGGNPGERFLPSVSTCCAGLCILARRMDDGLVALQERRELRAYADALGRFRKECERTPLEATSPGQALIRRTLPAFISAIQTEQERIWAGATPRGWEGFIAIESEKLALLTLNTLIHAMGAKDKNGEAHTAKVTLVQRRIGEACHVERIHGSINYAEKAIARSGRSVKVSATSRHLEWRCGRQCAVSTREVQFHALRKEFLHSETKDGAGSSV